ncbi:MAG TPA: 4-hydroxy-tetrahydrodipicolinate reductase [Candidatus Sulfotelmatobacter sp.]|nr:4-hydroxy-tetrahydrodipicolinate reductase [Candidatus Sulfotelmatobacter sp.]
MLRVGVAGALGRLGRVACEAVRAADDLELSAVLVRSGGGEPALAACGDARVAHTLADFLAGLDVVVDCTVHPATVGVALGAVDAGIPVVVGATGWTDTEILTLSERAQAAGVGAMLVPNFSLGANLMMRFAEQAARVFGRAEIIELHHDRKRDAPSGTAKLTARRIAATGAPEPPIHSVRLPGLVAHQEVIFGGIGETLSVRHDSLAHTSFAAGIVAAVRGVRSSTALVVGLDALLDRMLAP